MRNRLSLITIFLISFTVLFVSVKKKWTGKDGDSWKSIINGDGYAYAAYLPCVIIYHSFDYDRYTKNLLNVRPSVPPYDITRLFLPNEGNRKCNKCFVGFAIVTLPFFLLAYFLSSLLGYDLNGVSCLFQLSISIAALFYLIIGLVYLRKLLKLYSLPEIGISVTLLLIVFATNLFYYVVFEPSLAHVYGFSFTAIFLYNVKKYSDTFHVKFMAGMFITMAVLLLLRPTNILSVLFIPFVCGSYSTLLTFVKNLFTGWKMIPISLLSLLILFIQPFFWYLQTGGFIVKSYPGEEFNFLHPQFLNILFSYKKGLFVYTPIMLIITFAGLFVFWMNNKFRFISFFVFTITVIYIFSCWWCWWFGCGYSNRAFIDFYPEFGLVLGFIFIQLKSIWSWGFATIIALACTFLNLFQTDQYFNFILSPEQMTKERYWNIFLKRGDYFVEVYFSPDTISYNPIPGYTFINTHKRTEAPVVDKDTPQLQIYSSPVSKLPRTKDLNLFTNLWENLVDFNNRITLEVKVQTRAGDCYFEKTLPLQGFASTKDTWSEAYSMIPLPQFKDTTDILNVSVENKVSKVYIGDTKVRFALPK